MSVLGLCCVRIGRAVLGSIGYDLYPVVAIGSTLIVVLPTIRPTQSAAYLPKQPIPSSS